MIVYGIPNCNSVKKALDWLRAHEISFEFHDYKKKGIDAEKLNTWCAAFGWDNVLNKKGLTWKKLDQSAQQLIVDAQSAINYLQANTSAIKRPIIEIDNKPILFGFDEEKYNSTFL